MEHGLLFVHGSGRGGCERPVGINLWSNFSCWNVDIKNDRSQQNTRYMRNIQLIFSLAYCSPSLLLLHSFFVGNTSMNHDDECNYK
jgi:hypothetical protein